jgi:hypothetical protein
MPPDPWYKDAIALSTVIIATATVVNLLVSIFLWRATANATNITRKIYEAANRPYVGIPTIDTTLDPPNGTVSFICQVRNFGSIPAFEVDILDSRVTVDDKPLNATIEPFGTHAIFPDSQVFHNFSFTNAPDAEQVLATRRLEIQITLEYKGVNENKYRYEYHSRYHPAARQFMPIRERTT